MTLDELAASLPNGLHDALLVAFTVSHERKTLSLDLQLWVGDPAAALPSEREARRPVRLEFTGLVLCVVDPPDERYPFDVAGPLMIDAGDGQPSTAPVPLPPVPPGAFLAWVFVNPWNSFIRVVARDVTLVDPPPA